MPRWLGLTSPAMSSTASGTTPSHRDRKIKLLFPDRPLVAPPGWSRSAILALSMGLTVSTGFTVPSWHRERDRQIGVRWSRMGRARGRARARMDDADRLMLRALTPREQPVSLGFVLHPLAA